MYTSYALRYAVFISVIFCSRCDNSDVSRKNCSSYQQVFKENLRNCVAETDELENVDKLEEITGSTDDYPPSETHGTRNTPSVNLQNSWEIELTNITGLCIKKHQDDITLQLTKLSTSMEARKKRMTVMDIIPYLIIPGFISAGVIPWLIPGMKLAVMGVAMINQMAFTSSLFSLIRGYIFDTSQEDHIVYVNHGYEKYKYKNHLHSHR